MTDCADLIENLQAQARDHVQLAAMSRTRLVTAMHIELAVFSERQAQVAEELCEDD